MKDQELALTIEIDPDAMPVDAAVFDSMLADILLGLPGVMETEPGDPVWINGRYVDLEELGDF